MTQQTFYPQFDESESMDAVKQNRLDALERALTVCGYRYKHTVWKIARLVFNVTHQVGVLRWSVREIEEDGFVDAKDRSIRDGRKKLAAAGIVEIVPCPSLDGGDDIKGMRLEWKSIFQIAEAGTTKNQNLHPARHPAKQGARHPAKQGANSNSLLRTNNQLPPPPTPTLSADEKAAAAILKKHLCDAVLRSELASQFAAQIPDVVAEFELNRKLFSGPGAIKYRLQSGEWPTDDTVRCIDAHRRWLAREDSERAQRLAEAKENHRRDMEGRELESRFGSELDAMSKEALLELAGRVLQSDEFDGWKKYPSVYRNDLLKGIMREKTNTSQVDSDSRLEIPCETTRDDQIC